MGGDGIPPLFLKHCVTALVDPVHYLFSQCLSQSYLPQEWHSHLIIPIPKTDDKSQISNYRPISLLCNLSKALEKIVFDKIYEFISENSISIHQFGFMRNRSTLKQLILHTEFLYSSLDHHQQVDSIYLDIHKAFNSVPHNKLLVKLWSSGLTDSIWPFFKAYLTNRYQQVVLDHFSDWLPVTSAVPQGSILGPLLFIIYINDLPPVLASSFPYLFADDTKCCIRILKPSDSILLQLDLDHLFNWSYENNLYFNVSKFGLLRFLNRSSSPIHKSYCMNGIEIKLMNHFKNLGIIFSSDLSWTHHYQQIITKAYQKLGLIRHTFSSLIPAHTKQLLYLSLIRSQLTYCSQIWRPLSHKGHYFLRTSAASCH